MPPSPVAPPPSVAASSELDNNESDVEVDDSIVAQFTMIPPRLITQRTNDEDTSLGVPERSAVSVSANIPALDEHLFSPSLKSNDVQINSPSTFLQNRPPTPMPLNRPMHMLRSWVTVFKGLHQGVFDIT